jgi:hypothetical protein
MGVHAQVDAGAARDGGGGGGGGGVLRDEVRGEGGNALASSSTSSERLRWEAEKQRSRQRELVRLQLIFCLVCGASLVIIVALGIALVVTN